VGPARPAAATGRERPGLRKISAALFPGARTAENLRYGFFPGPGAGRTGLARLVLAHDVG
jgi:hypothetical protein